MLKKLIAWPLCWTCFWSGDLASHILNLWDNERWANFWYPLYNYLMLASSRVQDWAGGIRFFPWEAEVSPGD